MNHPSNECLNLRWKQRNSLKYKRQKSDETFRRWDVTHMGILLLSYDKKQLVLVIATNYAVSTTSIYWDSTPTRKF